MQQRDKEYRLKEQKLMCSGSVKEYLNLQAIAKRDECLRNLTSIRDIDGLEKRKAEIRSRLITALGGLPQRVDPEPELIGRTFRKEYTIENISIKTLQDTRLNLNLFIPAEGASKLPAVVFAAGHLPKTDMMHQYPVLELVKKGYIVALCDCYGRGEREYGNEHFIAGALSWINGRCMNRYFIHDNMQITDYLFTRPEVDKSRIICAGASGGGNTTIFHAALDDRVAAAASVCTISSFADLIEKEYSGCPEYYPPGLLGEGVDIADVAALIAPRPHIMIGGGKDELNSVASLKNTFNALKAVYKLYDAEDKIDIYIDPDGVHGCGGNMRRAMYEMIDREFLVDTAEHKSIVIGDVEPEPDIILNFMPDAGKTLIDHEYYAAKNGRLVRDVDKIKKLLGVFNKPVSYNVIKEEHKSSEEGCIDRFIIETDKDIFISADVIRRMDDKYDKIIINTDVKKTYIEKNSIMLNVTARGRDMDGLGTTPWDELSYCSSDRALSSMAICLGYPIIGQQIYDYLCVLDMIHKKYKTDAKTVLCGDSFAWLLSKCIEGYTVEINDIEYTFTDDTFDKAIRDQGAGISVSEEICKYMDIVPGISVVEQKG